MTSSRTYVWTWLPEASQPVVAGAIDQKPGGTHTFTYGKSYLDNAAAIPLGPDLALAQGQQEPAGGLDLHGTLRDALPDAWGQRVIMDQLTGRHDFDADTGTLDYQAYMLFSDSNRFGAIDFQASASAYVHRGDFATLDQLHEAADILDRGRPLPKALEAAAQHGTTMGGARPKAQIVDGNSTNWIAKFSRSSDTAPVVQAEYATLRLAVRAGLDVPQHQLVESLGKNVLLVERFDRTAGGGRSHATSMLSVLGLHEMTGRYASYPAFLDHLSPAAAGELFSRVALNIAVGNTDDHARNHAALWNGESLTLAPLFDIDPTARPFGYDANQAIAFGRSGERESNLAILLGVHGDFGLSRSEAGDRVDQIRTVVEHGWDDAADEAGLTKSERGSIRDRAILRELATDGLSRVVAAQWDE